MRRLTLENIYGGILLLVLALIVVHAPLSVFFGAQFGEYALVIKAWKEMLLFATLPIAALLATRAQLWPRITQDKLFWLIVAYVAVHALSLLMWQGIEAAAAGLAIDLRYVAYFALVYVLVLVRPAWAPLFKKVAVAGAVLVIGFGALQLLLPHDFLRVLGYGPDTIQPYTTIDRNYDFVRYQSTLRGPNPYGAYAAGVALIALAWLVSKGRTWRSHWPVALLFAGAVAAVYFSYARSAALGLLIGGVVLAAVYARRRARTWQLLAVGVVSLVLIAAGVLARDSDFVSNVVLHEDPEEGNMVNSNDGHWKSLVGGTERMLEQPLGAGVGSTGSASLLTDKPQIIENQYLLIAHEVGWLGLALFAAIYTVVMSRLWRQRADAWSLGLFASGVGLAVVGLLLPVWVDDTVSIVWWGLVGVVLAASATSADSSSRSLPNKH